MPSSEFPRGCSFLWTIIQVMERRRRTYRHRSRFVCSYFWTANTSTSLFSSTIRSRITDLRSSVEIWINRMFQSKKKSKYRQFQSKLLKKKQLTRPSSSVFSVIPSRLSSGWAFSRLIRPSKRISPSFSIAWTSIQSTSGRVAASRRKIWRRWVQIFIPNQQIYNNLEKDKFAHHAVHRQDICPAQQSMNSADLWGWNNNDF